MPHETDIRFGLLGEHLSHSWSPALHAHLGSTPYRLIEKSPDEVKAFIEHGTWSGLNVTIPYKKIALELAQRATDRTKRIGAANTLVRKSDGSIYADNTDYLGFFDLLDEFAQKSFGKSGKSLIAGRDVVVLGAGGGAARAIMCVLEDMGVGHILKVGRKGPISYEELSQAGKDALLLINCTPVGMSPNIQDTPLSQDNLAQLKSLRAVLDLIYNPFRTKLMLDAKDLGLATEGGLAMLVSQAYYSSQLFQDKQLDLTLKYNFKQDLIAQYENIALIGMPSSGKSGAGRRLAHKMGRAFVDMDDIFEIEQGQSSAEFIQTKGEHAFRELETAMLERYARSTGLVIATGGGVVMRDKNYDLLRHNSRIVFINRPLDELTSADRPISQQQGIEALAKLRMPRYKAWADYELVCTGSAAGDADVLFEWFNAYAHQKNMPF